MTSSNVGTIKIAEQLGKERLDAALRRFGLGTPTGLDFPGETRGLSCSTPRTGRARRSARSPIGQGISVTALQMLGAFNVIANDGAYVAPRLVDATVGADGTRRKRPVGATRRVVSEDTAAQVRAMMTKVVSEQYRHGHPGAVPGLHGGRQDGHRPQADDAEHARRRLHGPRRPLPLRGHLRRVRARRAAGAVDHRGHRRARPLEYYASDVSAPAFSELARYALRRYDIPPAAVLGARPDVPEVSASARRRGRRAGRSDASTDDDADDADG